MNKILLVEIEKLRASSRALVRELDVIKGIVPMTGFSFKESHTLIELGINKVLTVRQLSEILNIDKSNASRAASSLLSRGLIKPVKNGKDNRHKPFSLSGKGKKALEKINIEARRQVESGLKLLNADERNRVITGVDTYARALKKARMQSAYKLRIIERNDNEQIKRIIQKVMTEFSCVGEGYSIVDNEVNNMYEAYSGKRAVYYVIEKNGKVYGGGGIAPLRGGNKNICELKKMYFLKDLRGLGFGDKILELCLEAAKRLGFRKCYLETTAGMTQAKSLYEKHGFKRLKAPMGNTGHYKCDAWYERAI